MKNLLPLNQRPVNSRKIEALAADCDIRAKRFIRPDGMSIIELRDSADTLIGSYDPIGAIRMMQGILWERNRNHVETYGPQASPNCPIV